MIPLHDPSKLAHNLTAMHAFNQTHGWLANLTARMAHAAFDNPWTRMTMPVVAAHGAGVAAMADRLTRDYKKPAFGIPGLSEEIIASYPFCDLRRFVPEGALNENAPRILLLAPMSGHHATLLRQTVEGMAKAGLDVTITDWRCAAQVPTAAGDFTLDTYITYVQDMIRHFNGDVHVMAVCQPGVPALAAISLMEQARDPRAPKSLVMMGSPIDTRISPTAVNNLATERGLDWFKNNVHARVPYGAPGVGRDIYPGILQLMGFMAMNQERHKRAHAQFYQAAMRGDADAMGKHDEFYDEYKSVMDLPWGFYIQTIEKVFVDHHLPRGIMTHVDAHGRTHAVNPAAITRVALMTIEGEKDDITGLGQTQAAHDLAPNIPANRRAHHMQEGAGHYGIFNGSKWHGSVLPAVQRFVTAHDSTGQPRLPLRRLQPAA